METVGFSMFALIILIESRLSKFRLESRQILSYNIAWNKKLHSGDLKFCRQYSKYLLYVEASSILRTND